MLAHLPLPLAKVALVVKIVERIIIGISTRKVVIKDRRAIAGIIGRIIVGRIIIKININYLRINSISYYYYYYYYYYFLRTSSYYLQVSSKYFYCSTSSSAAYYYYY